MTTQTMTTNDRTADFFHGYAGGFNAIYGNDNTLVNRFVGVHGADDTKIVDHLGCVGQQFRDFRSTLAMLGKLPRSSEQLFVGSIHKAVFDVPLIFFAGIFGQFRLRIEKIHLRRAALHPEKDHALGLDRFVAHCGSLAGGG